MKNRRKFKPEVAAGVLVMAAYTSDDVATKKYGVSLRSLQNWRRLLQTDAEFAELFATKARLANKRWADDFLVPLRKAAVVIDEAFEEIRKNPRALLNPMLITAVAEAAATCADIVITNEAINAQFSNQDQPANQLPEEVSPAEEYAN